MNNIKSGDTILFQGLSSTVKNIFITSSSETFLTIYNQYDGEIEVNLSEITLEN
jgi:hypothetical protein